MLAWEFDDLDRFAAVHHLAVLCYHLQHPGLYSPEGLAGAKRLLVDFVEYKVTPQEARRRQGAARASGRRTYKLKGTPEAPGVYACPVTWSMTAADVVAGGQAHYVANVTLWAHSVYNDLKASHNLAA